MLSFRRGLERIMKGVDVPIIPVNLDGVWGSIFSFERGRFLWKMPRRDLPTPVTVSFGSRRCCPHLRRFPFAPPFRNCRPKPSTSANAACVPSIARSCAPRADSRCAS